MRWAARGGTALAVGGLALATVAGTWSDSGDDAPSPSPSPTPQLELAAATFPLDGGPEFAPISDAIQCGDPAPAPHPEQREIALSVVPDPPEQDEISGEVLSRPTVTASLLHTTDDPDGVAATSGITFLMIRNGVVVGMQDTGIQLGWRLDDPISPMSQGWMGQGGFMCPETDYGADARGTELAEGTYQVMAVARVFSTPEAVALSQVFANVGAYGLDPLYWEHDPQALYLPGSYDCITMRQSYGGSGPRGCLPDLSERASVNADDGTVTVLYEADDFVGPFSVVLASEPIDVEIQDSGSTDYWEAYQAAMPARLESLDQLQCGATFESTYLGYDKEESVTALFALSSDEPLADRGVVSAGIWATGVPDGTQVSMLPGARVVVVRYDNYEIEIMGESQPVAVSTLVGEATVTSDTKVVTDRYVGPQRVSLAYGDLTGCDGGEFDVSGSMTVMIAATWLLKTPDGRSFTVETTSEVLPSGSYIGTITS